MIDNLIVGSKALVEYGIKLDRKLGDIDAIVTPEVYENYVRDNEKAIVLTKPMRWGMTVFQQGHRPLEFEIAHPGTTAEALLRIVSDHRLYMSVGKNHYASPQVIYALKMSHRYLKNSPHFQKTMRDIHMLRSLGFDTIIDPLKDWFKERQRQTYDYSHPSLNQGKTSFFADDNVPYLYDHDTLHLAVKTFDKPAYEYIKKDDAEVFCSKEKFMEAPEHIKLATVLEESYVLALERHQIPNEFRPERSKSFSIALKKVCTSIASGWWREYAWENYFNVMALYDDSYVDRFHKALKDGIVRPYKAAA